jgi:hypothetical protein
MPQGSSKGDENMVERVADMAAIGQVLARYCRAIDRLDAALLESVYWRDARDDHGPFQGNREEFVEWAMREMRARHSVTAHALNQSYFEFRDDQAAVETHYVVRSWGSGDQASIFRILSGRYLDLMEKRDGEWRILERTTMYDSAGTSPAMPLDFQHIEGSRSRDDPSYRLFDTVRG